MNIQTEPYELSHQHLPQQGQHIIAHQAGDEMVVYQAYMPAIAKYAVTNQVLGGANFSYNRMSWIKPNFLWMMFRSGWAQKENQERILALWISRKDFDDILAQAAFTSFGASGQQLHAEWAASLESKEVRLQWDPDHDPYGQKITRRAMQLGLKGDILQQFGQEKVKKIEDITDFVTEQYAFVHAKQLNLLRVPIERVYTPADEQLFRSCAIDKY